MTKTEELREKIRPFIKLVAPFTITCVYIGTEQCPIPGNIACQNCNETLDQILKACQKAGLAFVGDIAYRLPNRYSHEVRVDDAYAQGFKDAQDKLFEARFRQTEEIEV